MEIIPLIYIRNKTILTEDDQELSLQDIKEQVEEGKNLYVFDEDGIDTNEPDLTLYQQLAEKYSLWIDNGPRNVDDVVDSVMAGAATILIRTRLFSKGGIPEIRETMEDPVYIVLDFQNQEPIDTNLSLFSDIDGVVLIRNIKPENNFVTDEYVKTLCGKYKIYVTAADQWNETYWNSIGAQGLLVPIRKKETVNKNGL